MAFTRKVNPNSTPTPKGEKGKRKQPPSHTSSQPEEATYNKFLRKNPSQNSGHSDSMKVGEIAHQSQRNS